MFGIGSGDASDTSENLSKLHTHPAAHLSCTIQQIPVFFIHCHREPFFDGRIITDLLFED